MPGWTVDYSRPYEIPIPNFVTMRIVAQTLGTTNALLLDAWPAGKSPCANWAFAERFPAHHGRRADRQANDVGGFDDQTSPSPVFM